MEVNLKEQLYAVNCMPFVEEDGKPVVLGDLIKNIVLDGNSLEQSENVNPEIKDRRYKLSVKLELCKDDSINLPAEDISMIKNLSAALSVNIYGAFINALEGIEHPVLKQKRLDKEELERKKNEPQGMNPEDAEARLSGPRPIKKPTKK